MRTKGEIHSSAEGQEKTHVSKPSLTQTDSVNKVYSKFLMEEEKSNLVSWLTKLPSHLYQM